ncbi:MAG TPA: nucleotidyltransferase family protein [Rhodocyclaceae bacterium]|nr:nucleotidyltransferase family protein [Rhodocyclaceae bacterium]
MTSTANPSCPELAQRLINIARQSAWFMSALVAVRELGLPSWCIGAGAVRNLVWDALHESAPSSLADVDVAYFDETATQAHEEELETRLTVMRPHTPWDVKNQARVHEWFEGHFGYPAQPLLSLEEAVASWPEYVTCVGLTLKADDSIEVIAPYGLDDLFGIVVRHNPVRASIETYRLRVAQKRYMERWPRVTVVHC